jgi:hypothetical protein
MYFEIFYKDANMCVKVENLTKLLTDEQETMTGLGLYRDVGISKRRSSPNKESSSVDKAS